MAVVTITRQYGSGGSSVAGLVATALGWTLVDNEFIETVARRAGLPVETVAAREERAPSLMQRLVRALATASPEAFVPAGQDAVEPTEEHIVEVTGRVIAEAAQHGRAVIVGRGAQAVLAKSRPDEALHAYIVAPREDRVREIAKRLSLDPKAASDALDRTDADRDRYVTRWHDRHRQDPANYHLVLNTGWLGYDGAAELIVAAARRRGW
ncbi:MAG TPA: cytidylate kinase-like family protein [Gemmatimonadales bacterium]|jgi:cytidylate kinase